MLGKVTGFVTVMRRPRDGANGEFSRLLVSDAFLAPLFTSAFFFFFSIEKGSVSEFLPSKIKTS